MSKLRVVELFAGVGGFRLGLEGWNGKSASSRYTEPIDDNYEVVWSNQWEPSTKRQHASEVYEARFGKNHHSNEDISEVLTNDIPNHDLLVGGFPCQDYSVASTLPNSKGLIGKKGILWWQIERILREKGDDKPSYLLLENVDRLLKSPVTQRGRDFAVMLKSLDNLGYAVEWRVINAAKYGMPQRRRRIFFLAYNRESDIFNKLAKNPEKWLSNEGVFMSGFPVLNEKANIHKFQLDGDLKVITDTFNSNGKKTPFLRGGVMFEGKVYTADYKAVELPKTTLESILLTEKVDDQFYIDKVANKKWEEAKGSVSIPRTASSGHQYSYSMGKMNYPELLDQPSRTIITGEGGSTPSRFKHVVDSKTGRRRLTPVELERLNMFPDFHTELEGISDTKRAFFMGNALVVGVVEKIGKALVKKINLSDV